VNLGSLFIVIVKLLSLERLSKCLLYASSSLVVFIDITGTIYNSVDYAVNYSLVICLKY